MVHRTPNCLRYARFLQVVPPFLNRAVTRCRGRATSRPCPLALLAQHQLRRTTRALSGSRRRRGYGSARAANREPREGGFSLHAATTAPAGDTRARETLCKYALRPPLAQERVALLPDGLVRILLKRPFSDGTVAVDLDPLSLLCRLAASVPPPRAHVVRHGGVLTQSPSLARTEIA